MPAKPVLKPSGYDVVIRNGLAMRKINRKLGKADPKTRDALLTEKDRLMEEMWASCPHDSILRCLTVKTTLQPNPVEARFCTSCGHYELRTKDLKRRRGRSIVIVAPAEFALKLGETLRRTGINAPST